jgi:hypothetical protein
VTWGDMARFPKTMGIRPRNPRNFRCFIISYHFTSFAMILQWFQQILVQPLIIESLWTDMNGETCFLIFLDWNNPDEVRGKMGGGLRSRTISVEHGFDRKIWPVCPPKREPIRLEFIEAAPWIEGSQLLPYSWEFSTSSIARGTWEVSSLGPSTNITV